MTTSSNAPLRAAVYLRQSLDAKRDGLAIERQRADCLRIVRERGWSVADEYADNSISASNSRKVRPGYDRLVADFASGMFDAIVCWDLDRLTRQPRQLEDWIDAATERGLRLVTANGEADLSTDGGRMYARIKASVARAEIERKGARQRAAAAQRAENGRPPLGPRLTGYTTKGKLVRAEADVVKKVFDRFDGGDSVRSIVAWLTDSGVPTRNGRPWNPSSVSAMLRNPRYAGRAVYDGAETGKAGTWKRIVADDVFERVQSRLRDPRRKAHHHGTDRRYLGSGLYLCGECGVPVISHTGERYRCPAGHLVRSGALIDAYVIGVLRGRLSDPDLADLLPTTDAGAVRTLTEELNALRGRLDSIESDYDEGMIDGRRYRTATDKVRAEMTAVQSRLGALTANAGPAGAIVRSADPVAAFDAAPLMLRRAVVELFLQVRLHPAPRGSRTFRRETVEVTWRADN